MARKLYVGNLPYDTGEQDLQALFAEAGPVDSVNVMRDMATGRARGFAFVEMASDADAQKAITQLNNYQLGGRNLTVNEARSHRAPANARRWRRQPAGVNRACPNGQQRGGRGRYPYVVSPSFRWTCAAKHPVAGEVATTRPSVCLRQRLHPCRAGRATQGPD